MSEVAAEHVEEAVEWRRKETATSARPESDAGTETRGVYKLLGGAYGASIWDRSSRIQVWLGTFHNAQDASRAYRAAAVKLRRRRRARKDAARPEPGARSAFRRVYPVRSGAFGAWICDPSSSFGTVEDAARAYAVAAAKLTAGACKPPKFRGVTRYGGKYGARISYSNGTARTQVWLGFFESAEEAAMAYDAAAVKLHGERVITNFGPDSGSYWAQVWLGTVEDAARVYDTAAAAVKLPGAKKRSKFRGVSRTPSGKYRAVIKYSKGTGGCTQAVLGTFESAEEAAMAYDAAAVKLHGARAITNFGPHSTVVRATRHGDLSTAETQQVHELLKDMDSTHDKEALIEAAAVLHQMGVMEMRRTNKDDDPSATAN